MTLRDDLNVLRFRDGHSIVEVVEAWERLRTVLTPSAEVWLAALPELLAIEDDATPGPWSVEKAPKGAEGWPTRSAVASVARGSMIYANPPGGVFPEADKRLIVAIRNALHRAQAAQ